MRLSVPQGVVRLLAATLGAAGVFVLTTTLMGQVPDAWLVAVSALGAFVVAAVSGSVSISSLWNSERSGVLLAAVGGLTALWIAPLLTLSQRASDAPSGSEVVFLTSSVWGVATVIVAQGSRTSRSSPLGVAGAVVALAGGASILASWETPSSFSPFVRLTQQQVVMCVAGVLFALGALALLAGAKKLGARRAMVVGAGAAALIGTVSALPDLTPMLAVVPRVWPALLLLAVAQATFAHSWLALSLAFELDRAAASLMLVPVFLTALTLLEKLTNIYGPNPIGWTSAIAGIAMVTAGVATMWASSPPHATPPQSGSWFLPASLLALATATASLVTPSIRASVAGSLGGGFKASWTMPGAETAAGWAVFGAALLSVATSIAMRRATTSRIAVLTAGVAALVCSGAYFALTDIPLRTSTRWIPAHVQQTYGTEYALLTFVQLADPVRMAALVLATATATGLIVFSIRWIRASRGETKGTL